MKRPSSKARLPKTRRDYILFAAILLAVALVAFFCTSIGWFLWRHTQFQDFVSALSDSTTYAYENDCLTTLEGDTPQPADRDDCYPLYILLSDTQGRGWRKVPEEAPLLTLYYGDGAFLELWPVELKGDTQRETGILFRFTSSQGKIWMYDTDRFGPNTLEKLFSS